MFEDIRLDRSDSFYGIVFDQLELLVQTGGYGALRQERLRKPKMYVSATTTANTGLTPRYHCAPKLFMQLKRKT
jgi:hypothetical protein